MTARIVSQLRLACAFIAFVLAAQAAAAAPTTRLRERSGGESATAGAETKPLPYGCSLGIDPDAKVVADEKYKYSEPAPPKKSAATGRGKVRGGYAIPVWFHVIRSFSGEGGWVTDAQLQQQIDVLNAAYAPLGISFEFWSVDHLPASDAWYRQRNETARGTSVPGQVEREMKELLNRFPSPDMLNIYYCEITDGLYGWARFPWDYRGHTVRNASTGRDETTPGDPRWDGIVMWNATLPGGRGPKELDPATLARLNNGRPLVHEVGHWLGLYHTFQGDHHDMGECSPDVRYGFWLNGVWLEQWALHGDMVHDTPTQSLGTFARSARDCRFGTDTCPGEGLDAVTNYMNSTEPACWSGFTDGQLWRAGLFATQRLNRRL